MSIDLTVERIFPLSQLFDHVEVVGSRPGRKPHKSTAFRWALTGSRGIVLSTISTPSGTYTSKEAFARFLEALTNAKASGKPSAGQTRSQSARRKASEAASRELTKRGV